jgi:uncharacterized lipoprotein YddW (UPF0748 family)
MKCKYPLLIILIFFQLNSVFAQETSLEPNREFRAVWLTTVFNLDWPKTSGAEAQKAELMKLFDELKEAKLNAVLFQVRSECDALYNSSKEPWSRYLSGGAQGQDPGYDPLAFAVEEAHKRGLELHAWVNPFRVNASKASDFSQDHISNTRPDWMLEFSDGGKIINPGIPEAREYIASVVEEIVQNYAVDGVHFDDYFYPYSGTTNEDAETYEAYGQDFEDIGDWRRHNINETVRLTNQAIKAIKPGVRFGISPFGIWKSGVPEGITGMSAYSAIYADALHWLEQQTIDYATPQLYWKIGGQQDFNKLLVWWAEQAKMANRHLYAGHTLNDITGPGARVAEQQGMRSIAIMESNPELWVPKKHPNARIAAQSAQEVLNQIAIVRENRADNALGSVLFRSAFLQANPHGFIDMLKEKTFIYPAAPPAMEWIEEAPPAAPLNLSVQFEEANGDNVLSWNRGEGNTHDFKRYLLYQLPAASLEGAMPEGAVRALVSSEENIIKAEELPFGTSYWGVAELGELNNESALSNVISLENIARPAITLPAEQESHSADQFARFEWGNHQGVQSYHYQWAGDAEFADILEENDVLPSSSTARLFNNLSTGNTYYFRLRARNASGWSEWSAVYLVEIGSGITGIKHSELISSLKVYPNPAEEDVFVAINIEKPTNVKVELISLTGQDKAQIVNSLYEKGNYKIKVKKEWVGSGIFLLVVQVDDFLYNYKMIFN